MCQLPSMRKWVRSVRSSASRISRCLPRGHDLADRGAGQVEGGQLGDAELAAAQRAAGQRGVHPLRGQPDGVSLGHASSVPGRDRPCSDGVSPLTTGMTRRLRRWSRRERSPATARPRSAADVPTPPAEPVTVTVARVVRPDQREAFERWADDVLGWPPGSPATSAPAAAPGAGQLRVPPGLPLRRRRVAGRVGAVVGAPVGAGPRRGHGGRRALRPRRRPRELLHAVAEARTALADDRADDRRGLRDHVPVPAVRDAAPGLVAAGAAPVAVGRRGGAAPGPRR